jgi:DNA (cytosine-5)-methyltransferase 1
MDWREGLERFGREADVIHASPPCQRYSQLTKWGRKERVDGHADLIAEVREALIGIGVPYVIENVERAPLIDPIRLCAWSFGFTQYRHRLFEIGGAEVAEPPHRPHRVQASSPGHFQAGTFMSVGGHFAPAALARETMGITWMSGGELAQAIPPVYAEYIGLRLLGRSTDHMFLDRAPGMQAKRLVVLPHMAGALAPLGEKGRPRGSRNKVTNGHINKIGPNTAERIVRRLKRDHPEIAEALGRGEYRSARAAGVAAGFVKVPTPFERVVKLVDGLDADDLERLRRHIRDLT